MVVRLLLVLVAFVVLYGCGQASSPVEREGKKVGAERADKTVYDTRGIWPDQPRPGEEPEALRKAG